MAHETKKSKIRKSHWKFEFENLSNLNLNCHINTINSWFECYFTHSTKIHLEQNLSTLIFKIIFFTKLNYSDKNFVKMSNEISIYFCSIYFQSNWKNIITTAATNRFQSFPRATFAFSGRVVRFSLKSNSNCKRAIRRARRVHSCRSILNDDRFQEIPWVTHYNTENGTAK